MMKSLLKWLLGVLAGILMTINPFLASAQYVNITTTVYSNGSAGGMPTSWNADSLLQHYFIGEGIRSVTNVRFNNRTDSLCSRIGFFQSSTQENLPLPSLQFHEGIIIGTGNVTGYGNPNHMSSPNANEDSRDCNPYNYRDPVLNLIAPIDSTIDCAILEFDFVPKSNTISFNYIFGSEEYPQFVCSNFNDAFGLFLSGPNPNGGNYQNQNIALLPNSQTPIAINTVNGGHVGSNINQAGGMSSSCDTINSQYYVDQIFTNFSDAMSHGIITAFNGQTVPLQATAQVIACRPYHIKIVLADVRSGFYDSGVFLESNSFRSEDTIRTHTNYYACDNSLSSFTWNDRHYTHATTDSMFFRTTSGCDSMAYMNLFVGNTTYDTIQDTACNQYHWYHRPYCYYPFTQSYTINQSGTYESRLIHANTNGCDSVLTLNLIINHNSSQAYYDTCLQNDLPRTFNSLHVYPNSQGFNNYDATSSYYNKTVTLYGQNQWGCDSIIYYHLHVWRNRTTSVSRSICPSALPYSWGNQTFHASGTLIDSLQTSHGADSIVIYHLTVNQNTSQHVSRTITENQLATFIFNGQSYPASSFPNHPYRSTTHHDTIPIQNHYGCDSTIYLTLNIYWNVRDTADTTICNNHFPFHWNNKTFTSSGTQTTTLQASRPGNIHVDSLLTMNVSTKYTSTSETSTTQCDSYSWFNQNYATSGNYTHLIPNSNSVGCDSTITLHLTLNHTTSQDYYDTCRESDLPHSFNAITITPSSYGYTNTCPAYGSYTNTLRLENENQWGCDSLINYHLHVWRNRNTTDQRNICHDELPYSWANLTFTAAGTQRDTLLTTHGCDSIVNYILTVTQNPIRHAHQAVTENQLATYNFHGHSYPATLFGSNHPYSSSLLDTLIVLNPYGCDSTIYLNLTVYWNVSHTADTTCCNNLLPFVWNNKTFLNTGTQNTTLYASRPGALLVDSLLTMNVSLKDTSQSDTAATVCDNYLWHNHNYTLSGRYGHTFANANSVGCDSTQYLQLTVNYGTSATYHDFVRENQLPYTSPWADSLTFSNDVADTAIHIQTTLSCDSVIHYSLTVYRNVFSYLDSTLCENAAPLYWNGKTFINSRTDTTHLPGLGNHGVDSTINMMVTINHNTTSNVSDTLVENNLPYTFNGCNYSNQSPFSTQNEQYEELNDIVTISNALHCDSNIHYHLFVYRNIYDTVDSTLCENQLPLSWNGFNFDRQHFTTDNPHYTHNTNLAQQGLHGVDSLLTMRVHTLYNSSAPFADTITENELATYTFLGVNFSDSVSRDSITRHTIIIPNHEGCDSVITVTLVVNWNIRTDVYDTICINALSTFTWNDSTFSGTEVKCSHLISQLTGADSSVYMHLMVHPNTTNSFVEDIVQDSLPYTFNYNTYNPPAPNPHHSAANPYPLTTQTDTLLITNHNGCDSTIYYTLNTWWNVYDTIDSTLCENYLPVTWNGVPFTTDDTITANLNGRGQNWVDSILTMRMHVLRNSYSTIYDTVIENSLPRVFNHVSINDSITHTTITIPNTAGCDSLIDYSLYVHWNIHTYTDSTVCQNEMPVVWKDSLFNVDSARIGQVYILTKNRLYHTIDGADSLVTMNLRVNPNTYASIYDTVIQNALPYAWEDSTFRWNEGRVKVKIISNANGCDSIVTMNLHVWENVTASADSILCENALPLVWNDSTFTFSATKTTKIYTIHGADSTLTMNTTVHYNSNGIVYDTIVENELTYHYHGYPLTGPVADSTIIFPNQYHCDSIVRYNLHVYWNVYDSIRYTCCQNDTPQVINGISFTHTSSTSIILRAHTGADSILWMHVDVYPNTFGVMHEAVTENELPHYYYGHEFVSDVTDSVIYIPGFNAHGCDSSISYSLLVYRNTTATADTTICAHQLPFVWNDSVFMGPGSKMTYILTTHGADSTLTMNVQVNPDTYSTDTHTACGYYTWINGTQYTVSNNTDTVRFVNQYQCDSIVTLDLTVNYVTTAPARYDTICINELPYPYEDTIFMPGTTSNLYNIFQLGSNGCDSIIPYHLHVYPLPILDATMVEFRCNKWEYMITSTHTADVDHVTWTANPPDSTLVGQEENDVIFVAPTQTTTYTASGSVNEHSCHNSKSITLDKVPQLEAKIRYNPPYTTPDQLEILFYDNSSGNIENRLWELPDYQTDEREFTYVYPVSYDSILVTLIVTEDRFHCPDTATQVIEYKGGIVWVANAFSPDMAENNRFIVKTNNVVFYEIFIYDRDGTLRYHSTDKEEAWDGTHLGHRCPQANYVYKIIYTTEDHPKTKRTMVGNVILLR